MGVGFLFGGVPHVQKLIMVILAHSVNVLKTIELYTFKSVTCVFYDLYLNKADTLKKKVIAKAA